jgi:hypothetical protein
MSEKTWTRDTSGLAAHARSRKERKRNAVENALTTLLREQKPMKQVRPCCLMLFATARARPAETGGSLPFQGDTRAAPSQRG